MDRGEEKYTEPLLLSATTNRMLWASLAQAEHLARSEAADIFPGSAEKPPISPENLNLIVLKLQDHTLFTGSRNTLIDTD